MAKIKLLRVDLLEQAVHEHSIGVPLARILKNIGALGDISIMSLLRMINTPASSRKTVFNPPWLDASGSPIQNQPDDYRFDGVWPDGVWVVSADTARLTRPQRIKAAADSIAAQTPTS